MKNKANVSGIVSLRLSQEERQLVEEAAAKKGWKTAQFLRLSALERAAQVLNLSRPTSFDFSGIARRMAQTLVRVRDVELVRVPEGESLGRFGEGGFSEDEVEESVQSVELGDVYLNNFGPASLTPAEIEDLHRAICLGGVEFGEQLITECRRLVNVADDPNLPPPIDPNNLAE